MTVPSDSARSGPYSGNGVNKVFGFDFKILHASHLRVIRRAANGAPNVLTMGVDYSITGVGNPAGGSVTLTVAPAAGQTITLLRNVPFVQETDLENQGAYYAETVERAFDLVAMRDQQMREELDRAVKIPENEDPAVLDRLARDVAALGAIAGDLEVLADIKQDIEAVAAIADDVSDAVEAVDVVNAARDQVTALRDEASASADRAELAAHDLENKLEWAGEAIAMASAVRRSIDDAMSSEISEDAGWLETLGQSFAGDGGRALWVRAGSEPAHAIKLQSADGAWWEYSGSELNFAAVPGVSRSGSADMAPLLNAAIEYAQMYGIPVRIPAGEYRLDDTVTMRSGVTVICEPGVVFETSNWLGASSGPVIQFHGSMGGSNYLAANRTSRATTLLLEEETDILPGDFFLIKGQRNALSRADAGDYWCGAGTASLQSTYCTEWLQAKSISSDRKTITLRWGLFWPDYLISDAGEVFPAPNGRRSRVISVDPCVNAHWRGGTFRVSPTLGCSMYAAVDCSIEGARFEFGPNPGAAISMAQSFRCRAFNCDATAEGDYSDILDRNHFKITGAQECTYDTCRSWYGSQSFDLTYSAGSGPTLNCRVINCSIYSAQYHAVSTHPGCYGVEILNNQCVGCLRNGIVIRSPFSVVSGNRVNGLRYDSSTVWGINLSSGGAYGSLVEGNRIDGFTGAINLQDGAGTDQDWRWVGCKVTSNYINRCNYGLWRQRNSGAYTTDDMCFEFSGNYIFKPGSTAIYIGQYSPGVDIVGNTVYGAGNSPGISIDPNTPMVRIIGNKIIGSFNYGILHQGVDDTVRFPDAGEDSCVAYGNEVRGSFSVSRIALDATMYRDLNLLDGS